MLLYLVSLVVSRHGDAGGGDCRKVGTDLMQAQRILHPLLSSVHQHLLKLRKKKQITKISQGGRGATL